VTLIAAAISFSLGVYLAARTIAALYRVIDLWYAIRREWLRVTRGILGWGGAAALAVLLTNRVAFLSGLAFYAVLFVVVSLTSQLRFAFRLRD
jgi:hypothetical protein